MTAGATPFNIRLAPLNVEPSALAELYASVSWGTVLDYDDAHVRALLAGATFCATAEVSDRTVGLVRAFSDKVAVTWIAEILVHPSTQRQGIGRALVETVLSEFGHTAIYAEALVGTERFFERVGIAPRPKRIVACSRRPNA